MSNPSNQLRTVTRINGSIIKTNEIQQLSEIEKLLQNFEEAVKKQIEMMRQNIIQLKAQFGEIGSELNSNLKLSDVVQSFYSLAQMDSYQGTKDLDQLEDKLNNISNNLFKTFINAYQKAKDTKPQIFDDTNNFYQIIERENSTLKKKALDILQNVLYIGMPSILQEDLGQFPEIHQQISQGKITSYQLIYQGTIHGLRAQQYWAYCNNQQNLLTIMTSKNGNRFGGYSPCLLNKDLNSYVQDPTMKSFIFQYHQKQIYKLKNQSYAIYCNANNGPCYGGGHDIQVNADFNQGSSALGHSYDVSNQQIVDKGNHIFGASTPQLQEIKVYKVIF